MKKLLFLILLLPLVAFGQMKVTSGKNNGVWYRIYEPKVKSNNYLVWLVGLGELGNSSGTTLDLIEKVGYPKAAKSGYEFDFNIIAFQLPAGTYNDYWMIQDWAVDWIKTGLKADKIIVTGYSLGGRGAWTLLRYDVKGYIDAIAPVAGYYDAGSQGPVKDLRSVKGYSWHGAKDGTMRYDWAKGGADAYNATHTGSQVIDGTTYPLHAFKTLPNAGHDAWTEAYDLNGSLLKWINNIFGPLPPVPMEQEVKVFFDKTTQKLIFKTPDGEVVTPAP